MQRIVVGVDGSPAAQEALRWAVEEARLRNAVVDAIHAWQIPVLTGYAYTPAIDLDLLAADGDAVVNAAVDEVDTTGVTVERRVVNGSAAKVLVEEAKGADLVVVGSRGRGGFTGLLLGSVSQQVVHHAPCPVVVVRPAA